MTQENYVFDDVDFELNWGNYTIRIINLCHGLKTYTTSHFHHGIELHLITSGKCDYIIICFKSYSLNKGDYIALGKGIYHEEIPVDCYDFCINFDVFDNERNCAKNSEEDNLIKLLQNIDLIIGSQNNRISELFEELFREIVNKQSGYYLCAKNILSDLIINIARLNNECNCLTLEPPIKLPYSNMTAIIDKYFAHISSGLVQNPSPIDLANLISVSVRQLNRIFKKYYNSTYEHMTIASKVERAKGLLGTTTQSMDMIAEACGWSERVLSSNFKKLTSITPNQYRKNIKRQ